MSSGQGSNPSLHKASEQDLPAVLQLHRAAFPAGEVEQIIQVVHELWSDSTDATHSALAWDHRTQANHRGHLSLSSITTQNSQMVGWILAPLQ